MLNQPTIEKLQTMKLHGMAEAFRQQVETPDSSQLSFEERFGLLVDHQWTWKENRALTRRLQLARFKERRTVEDIDYQHSRGLDRKLMRTLATSEWVRQHHNLLVIGPTGIGKIWLACALAHRACRDGFFALHKRMAELFRELAMARADGSIGQLLVKLSRIDVLVLDDFAMAPLKDSERRDFLEICDDRYQRRSTILTSQMPVAHWHEQIGDPSIADSIMDRLVHNAYRIELSGESIARSVPANPARRTVNEGGCPHRRVCCPAHDGDEMILFASSRPQSRSPPNMPSLTDADQSVNMKSLGSAVSDLYRHQIGIHYFLHRNPQLTALNVLRMRRTEPAGPLQPLRSR